MRKAQRYKVLFSAFFLCMMLSVLPSSPQGRDFWQQPERVMDVIGVKQGMTIGEIGAGRGYFTFKLARRVSREGRIYANDIDQKALRSIDDRCRNEKITNIVTILGEVADPLLPKETLDMAFMSFVLHLLEKPEELLKNLKPSLKSKASLIIIDPRKAKLSPSAEKMKIIDLVTKAGYKFVRKETFIDRANIYIFKIND